MSLCLRCGYDLRATQPESPCPECGLAAHRSVIEHEHPDDCPPRWVRSIAIGATLLLASYLGFGLLLFAFTFLSNTSFGPGIYWMTEPKIDIQSFPPGILYAIFGLSLLHQSANLILARDEKLRRTRRISRKLRWGLWVSSFIPSVGLALAGYWLFFPPLNRSLADIASSIVNWFLLPLLLCPALTFFLLRRLALRLSRPHLAEHVGIVAVGCAISLALLAFSATFTWGDLRHGDAYFFFLWVMPCVFVWLFDLWATLLLFVVVDRFWKSARESRARWQKADASIESNPA
jgi:hypothetical protein